jgi:hypothetical protein
VVLFPNDFTPFLSARYHNSVSRFVGRSFDFALHSRVPFACLHSRVSRLICRGASFDDMELILDVNVQLYPMELNER